MKLFRTAVHSRGDEPVQDAVVPPRKGVSLQRRAPHSLAGKTFLSLHTRLVPCSTALYQIYDHQHHRHLYQHAHHGGQSGS